ncbi:Sec1-binding region of Mso1-domain-containing protein [Podospora didyma]|uniref:Sec1-binding region of Mso1-domain-containing protein n=1 Tax=Podospora didyma TaxID=330526 RepID=A0AAE0KLC4_9PEZI|nr:Sec1-binding region of Mso1-domain-containing protein [Podospora didyma]
MASWYKGLISNASTNISKLQRTYFGGESDGDTEDDTHVCRVLRNYYTEKGQQFPGWLPPDPKAPPPQQPVYASQQQQVGNRYGGLTATQQTGLSALWDNNRQGAGRGQPMRSPDPASRNPFASRGSDAPARPSFPNQAGGSYQQPGTNYGGGGRAEVAPGPTSSAQEKLKQKLWGAARSASPGAGPFQPPAPQQQQQQQPSQGSGSSNKWGRGGGGGGGGDYEDRFAPQGAYDNPQAPPVMGANAPWSSEPDYPPPGGRAPPRRVGLPSGPRGGGLPGNPRIR